jgi:hypothetical protein
VTDRGLQTIANNLKGLEALTLSSLLQITDKGIGHLAALHKLKLLDVRTLSA